MAAGSASFLIPPSRFVFFSLRPSSFFTGSTGAICVSFDCHTYTHVSKGDRTRSSLDSGCVQRSSLAHLHLRASSICIILRFFVTGFLTPPAPATPPFAAANSGLRAGRRLFVGIFNVPVTRGACGKLDTFGGGGFAGLGTGFGGAAAMGAGVDDTCWATGGAGAASRLT